MMEWLYFGIRSRSASYPWECVMAASAFTSIRCALAMVAPGLLCRSSRHRRRCGDALGRFAAAAAPRTLSTCWQSRRPACPWMRVLKPPGTIRVLLSNVPCAPTEKPPLVNRGGSGLVPEAGIEPACLSARDFLTTSTFAAALCNAGRSWSGARLHPSLAAVGARRLLSTHFPCCRLGLARRWLGCRNIQGVRRL